MPASTPKTDIEKEKDIKIGTKRSSSDINLPQYRKEKRKHFDDWE